ncbi:hypothetical protein GPECTOR_78g64 [Gonium pectorale]|uniref:Xrn1 N-terminal domain-containing protein n=1 Tax=Gonium pectorale TaxID=33097 RepID=A0A150G1X6_GONPE|nr:hypothetical protein GPECTOR_78g64 [Gonium pectorale]|eukprot:KXZ43876.1 hypothetical protein GPECTOR_78g64 [Gonium pectorale]
MGVPGLFAFLKRRYGVIARFVVKKEDGSWDGAAPADALYVDMNHIIHTCTHAGVARDGLPYDEDAAFERMDAYLTALLEIVGGVGAAAAGTPGASASAAAGGGAGAACSLRLLFVAIDGVAPIAKMNQQRTRRFLSAHVAEVTEKVEREVRAEMASQSGGARAIPDMSSGRFDPNIISPGTAFMGRVAERVRRMLRNKVATDPRFARLRVMVSDSYEPAEGEHKIMRFIRHLRTRPEYDPNTRHAIYGQDADLLLLSLLLHEPHVRILREGNMDAPNTAAAAAAAAKARGKPGAQPGAQTQPGGQQQQQQRSGGGGAAAAAAGGGGPAAPVFEEVDIGLLRECLQWEFAELCGAPDGRPLVGAYEQSPEAGPESEPEEEEAELEDEQEAEQEAIEGEECEEGLGGDQEEEEEQEGHWEQEVPEGRAAGGAGGEAAERLEQRGAEAVATAAAVVAERVEAIEAYSLQRPPPPGPAAEPLLPPAPALAAPLRPPAPTADPPLPPLLPPALAFAVGARATMAASTSTSLAATAAATGAAAAVAAAAVTMRGPPGVPLPLPPALALAFGQQPSPVQPTAATTAAASTVTVAASLTAPPRQAATPVAGVDPRVGSRGGGGGSGSDSEEDVNQLLGLLCARPSGGSGDGVSSGGDGVNSGAGGHGAGAGRGGPVAAAGAPPAPPAVASRLGPPLPLVLQVQARAAPSPSPSRPAMPPPPAPPLPPAPPPPPPTPMTPSLTSERPAAFPSGQQPRALTAARPAGAPAGVTVVTALMEAAVVVAVAPRCRGWWPASPYIDLTAPAAAAGRGRGRSGAGAGLARQGSGRGAGAAVAGSAAAAAAAPAGPVEAQPRFDFEQVLEDLVVLTFLAGNDFLPHVPSVDIYDLPSGLELLLAAYKALLPEMRGCITQGSGQINAARLSQLFGKLARDEEAAFLRRAEHRRRCHAKAQSEAAASERTFWDAASALLGPDGVSVGELPPGVDLDAVLSGISLDPGLAVALGLDWALPSLDLATASEQQLRQELAKRVSTRTQERVMSGDPWAADPCGMGLPGYRSRYYLARFPEIDAGGDVDKIAARVVRSYMDGLSWVYRYYCLGPAALDFSPARRSSSGSSGGGGGAASRYDGTPDGASWTW